MGDMSLQRVLYLYWVLKISLESGLKKLYIAVILQVLFTT
jgi:hypothetical protein